MNLNDIKLKRKELNIIAKNTGIEDPHKISTNDLMKTLIRHHNLSKEDPIYTLLKSEKNLLEDNYMNYINIVTDDRIKGKINNIRLALIKLGNILTENDRERIKEELYVTEKRQNLPNAQKDRIYNYLIEIATALDKTEAYKYHNYDDLDYFGIRDIENLFDNIDDLDYYKPILTKNK